MERKPEPYLVGIDVLGNGRLRAQGRHSGREGYAKGESDAVVDYSLRRGSDESNPRSSSESQLSEAQPSQARPFMRCLGCFGEFVWGLVGDWFVHCHLL